MTQEFLHPTDRRRSQRKLYGSLRWDRVRARVLERDGGVCQVRASEKCRVRANTVDHIVRPEEGGALYDEANLRASCRSCNMVRHNAAYFRAKVDAAAAGDPVAAHSPSVATARAGPVFDPDGIEVQKRLPLIDSPHEHVGSVGIDRHTALFAFGAMFRVCPRDCPDRSRVLVPR